MSVGRLYKRWPAISLGDPLEGPPAKGFCFGYPDDTVGLCHVPPRWRSSGFVMTKKDEGGGGAVGKLWRKHGGGYYALLAVGTFMYLEFTNLTSSIRAASGIRDFLVSELLTFVIESIINTLLASLWPLMWFRWMGTNALYWAGGGYLVWAILIAFVLSRREAQMRKELGL